MDQKIIDFNKSQQHTNFPKVSIGDVVRVHRNIKEGNKSRIQVFEGFIIAIKGKQSSSPTITVRKVTKGIGVEMIFPIFSPVVTKIEIVRHSKVRRSKLYYMRERFGKAAKMKTVDPTEKEANFYNKPEEKKSKKNTDNNSQSITEKEKKDSKTVKKENNKEVVKEKKNNKEVIKEKQEKK